MNSDQWTVSSMDAPNRPLVTRHSSLVTVLLFLACLLFHTIGIWSVPLIDRDEPRFAEASREMIERGDHVVPHFNNQLRLDKPPLAYWIQVGSYKIFGENDFAARFPSAVAAALVALSIFFWGKRIVDETTGWWAAIIFTLSLQTFVHAKAAVADMWLVLFVTTAHWTGYELLQARKTKWWWVFYVSLALGFLAKGPIAWTPLLTVAAASFFSRRAVEAGVSPAGKLQPGAAAATEDIDVPIAELNLGRRFKFIRGTLLMLALVALWGVPALLQTHGEFFRIGIGRHVIGRSFGAMESHGANSFGLYLLLLPFYFVTIFASFFPWSIKLPALATKLWRAHDNIDVYLLSGAAIVFIIFSLIKTKLPHYTLPAFPLLALLTARHISSERFLKCAATTVVIVLIALALIVPPIVARFFPAAELSRKASTDLRPEMEFGAVDFQEPSLVWYFRSRVKGWMTPLKQKNVGEFMNRAGSRFVILPTAEVAQTFPNPPSSWKTFATSGLNVAKGKHVDLTLVLKPD